MGGPREEDITKVEDEGRRFRKGHDYVLEGGTGGNGANRGRVRGKIVTYL